MLTKSPSFYVMSANRNLGKTIFTSGLCASMIQEEFKVLYLKPIQTGFPKESDSTFIKSCNNSPLMIAKTIFSLSKNLSPHKAAQEEYFNTSKSTNSNLDERMMDILKEEIKNSTCHFNLIEGSGGVASPSLNGNLQCEIYRILRLPVIFVADYQLGGISSSITSIAFLESLGFDIACILMFEGEHKNPEYLTEYYKNRFPIFPFSNIESKNYKKSDPIDWISENSHMFSGVVQYLSSYHLSRENIIEEYLDIINEHLWLPHSIAHSDKNICYIDNAFKDNITILNTKTEKNQNLASYETFECSASQGSHGIAYGNSSLANAAANAIGRYGDIQLNNFVYESLAKLTQKLIQSVGQGWASRALYCDSSLSAIDTAIKIAFSHFASHKLNPKINNELYILGLKNAAHDFWNSHKGIWLNFPQVTIRYNQYQIYNPKEFNFDETHDTGLVQLEDLFEPEKRSQKIIEVYENYILKTMQYIEGCEFTVGALILKPIIQDKNNMIFVDPLFQQLLIHECRKRKIPVIFDEVFSGFYRLGKASAARILKVTPDIACYSKIFTAGLLPLSTVLTRQEYYSTAEENLQINLLKNTFNITPLSCSVAYQAIHEIHNSYNYNKDSRSVIPKWNQILIDNFSQSPHIDRVFVLGTIFIIELNPNAPINAKMIENQLKNKFINLSSENNTLCIVSGFDTNEYILNSLLSSIWSMIEN